MTPSADTLQRPLYMNVYKSGRGAVVYESLAEARECASAELIAVVKLEEAERATPEQTNEFKSTPAAVPLPGSPLGPIILPPSVPASPGAEAD